MKSLYYLLLMLLAFSSCKKDKKAAPITPPNIVQNQSVVTNSGRLGQFTLFSTQDSLTVFGLMNSNNLSTTGFVFYYYQSGTELDGNNQQVFSQLASAKQIRNGLPMFFKDFTFAFENGKVLDPIPAGSIVGNISLDTKPLLSLDSLSRLFIKTDNAQEGHSIHIEDSTLEAQLGYYDLNISTGETPNYVKAWFVHPLHNSWPRGYFRDDSGAVLLFTPYTTSGPPIP